MKARVVYETPKEPDDLSAVDTIHILLLNGMKLSITETGDLCGVIIETSKKIWVEVDGDFKSTTIRPWKPDGSAAE